MKHISVLALALLLIGACSEKPVEKVLAVPSGLAVTDSTETSATVKWDPVEGAESYRWAVLGKDCVLRGFGPDTTLDLLNLPAGTHFTFSVRSEAGLVVSEWAEIDFYTVKTPEPPITHSIPAVFIGDSITEIWPSKDPSFFNSHHYMGKGISGQTSRTIAARFKNDVVKNDPYVVHILCGTNDVAENDGYYVESSAILANIEKMADQAEEAKIKVVVGAILPATKFWWWADDWKPSKSDVTIDSHIQEANALIEAWCAERGYPFVDYYGLLVGPGATFPGPYSYDGVHPDTAGFLKMDSLVQPIIEQLLEGAVL